MNYLKDLGGRVTSGKMLSTRERAFFNALLGAFVGFVVNLLPQMPYLLSGGAAHINITFAIIAMFVSAFILAFASLLLAQTDPVKAEIFRAYSEQLEQAALSGLQVPAGTVPVVHIVAPVAHPVASVVLAPVSQQSALAQDPPVSSAETIAEMPTAQMTAHTPMSTPDAPTLPQIASITPPQQ